jgi:succinate dehydrogenase / fumarate reductase flavoprotein subunit
MYHQFKELADVDITREMMEVGPTSHYMNGGVRVDADTAATRVPGLFAAGEVAGGLHGANRLGGNSLSDLVVFGRRAGLYAAEYVKHLPGSLTVDTGQLGAIARECLEPFERGGDENPYTVHRDLQECMQTLVGIIRNEGELKKGLEELAVLRERQGRVRVEGNRQYNPSWHLSMDLQSMLTVAEAVTRAALERKESRGAHTREDYPRMDPKFGSVNVVVRRVRDEIAVSPEPLPQMPDDLKRLFEEKSK